MIYVTRLLEGLWGFFAWLIFLVCVVYSLLVVTFVPGLPRRRHLTAGASKAIFVLSGTTVELHGLENLPGGNAVAVANHASYVDGFLLRGYLPEKYAFVIKGEMRKVPVVHFLLRRAGARFVERFSTSGSARDARQLVKAAKEGQSLAFFAEGTFSAEPGLARFRPGAFSAAIKGEMPVVPVAISGTRRMMPSGNLLPRPGRLRIEYLPPILPDDPDYADNRLLAEAARQRILAVLDEPDLAPPA